MNPTRTKGNGGPMAGVEPVIADGLSHLGLTAYEIRVYQAILQHPQSRVPEIARASGVPQPKVYATVKRLLERGLCESHLGPVNQYTAIDPKVAFEPLLNEFHRRQNGASEAIAELQQEHERAGEGISRREGRVKLFQGRAAAARNFNELLQQVEGEVAVVARFPLVVKDYARTAGELIRNGARFRILWEIPDSLSPDEKSLLDRYRKVGVELRRRTEVPMRMVVYDRRITGLPMEDRTEGGFTMLEIRNVDLSRSFQRIYDLLWDDAGPV